MTTDERRANWEVRMAERWRMATSDVKRFANECHPTEVLSDRFLEMDEAMMQLATRLVEDPGESEHSSLESSAMIGALHDAIRDKLCAWAIDTEMAREDSRASMAVPA